MRGLKRNKQNIYYALYEGKREITDEYGNKTGESEVLYSTPVLVKMSISASKGNSELDLFGININYTKTIITDDINCPIKEDSIIWIGTSPQNEPHNYVVVQVAKSLNNIAYAVREVDVS